MRFFAEIMNGIMHSYCINKFISTLDTLLYGVQRGVGCKGQYDFDLGKLSLDPHQSICNASSGD